MQAFPALDPADLLHIRRIARRFRALSVLGARVLLARAPVMREADEHAAFA